MYIYIYVCLAVYIYILDSLMNATFNIHRAF